MVMTSTHWAVLRFVSRSCYYPLLRLMCEYYIPSTVKYISAHFLVCKNSSRSFSPIFELWRTPMLWFKSVSPHFMLKQMDSNKSTCHILLSCINMWISSGSSSLVIPGKPKRSDTIWVKVWNTDMCSEYIFHKACKNGLTFNLYCPAWCCTTIMNNRGPFYLHRLILTVAWTSNCMHSKMWDETVYSFPKFNGCTVKFGNGYVILPTLYWACDHSSMLGLESIHINKRDPMSQSYWYRRCVLNPIFHFSPVVTLRGNTVLSETILQRLNRKHEYIYAFEVTIWLIRCDVPV